MNGTSTRSTPDPLPRPMADDDPLADPAAASAFDDAPADKDDNADDASADAGADGAPAPARASVDDARLAAWIDAIVERDERALAALYDATLARVYGVVLRIVHRPALAEEVVEDTYFQVWRQAVRFDAARGRALTWLLGMARSRAIDMLRREARYRHESLDDEDATEPADDGAGRDELLDVARSHAELHRALMLLNAQPRQLVALAFFRGLSHEEIASQTALPLGTVKSQIRRAMLTLRQALGDGGTPALAT
jgi:RNA polymerase sigma factor (sigma-70 family)